VPARKLILIVIDGLTAATFEQAVEPGRTPWLARLAAVGEYRRGVSTFPSLTPVCLSSIATGAHPDVHHIPHLVWYSRKERRLVEYGSSFGAVRRAGLTQSLRDSLVEMNARHLSRDARTIFETLEDSGLVTASVNFTCYRGGTRYRPTVPGLCGPVHGPKEFFFYSIFQSHDAGAPLAWRSRSGGSIDAYATAVGRWLVTRDGFDFFVFYLSDYDYASHVSGPDGALAALERCDRGIGALVEAAGGFDSFLERYGVLVCADHGQTAVKEAHTLEPHVPERDLLVAASNRAGMVYRLSGETPEPAALAERLDGVAAVEVALYREGAEAVARRAGELLRFVPAGDGFRTSGDTGILDYPQGMERAWAALANPNAGELLLSAREGVEFADLGGGHHAGGGSHGSLVAGDSEVPLLGVGAGPLPDSITGLAPLVARSFGVEPPLYAPATARAA
jgi:hypothetical protein